MIHARGAVDVATAGSGEEPQHQLQMFRNLFEDVDDAHDNAAEQQQPDPDDSHDDEIELKGNSLGCLAPENGLRRGLKSVLSNKLFEVFILLNIAVISVTLVMQSPSNQPSADVKEIITIRVILDGDD